MISSEDFEGCLADPARFGLLIDKFEKLDLSPEIIVYLRIQDEYIVSLYFELLQHGYSKDFQMFVKEITSFEILSFRSWHFWFNYKLLIEQLNRLSCQYTLRPYTHPMEADVVEDFCDQLEIPFEPGVNRHRENCRSSLGNAYQAYLRNSKRVDVRVFQEQIGQIKAQTKIDFKPETRAMIAARFADSNEKVSECLGKAFKIRTESSMPDFTFEQIFSFANNHSA